MVVKGDQVEYFDTLHKVVASGNVVATYREAKLTCDQATIYTQTKDAYLRGHVRLLQPSGLLKGREVIYNFETHKGTVLEAEGEAGPWRTKGDHAQEVAPTAFELRDGYLTTCDFEEPHSRLKAKEVRIFMGDRVVLKHAVMYVGSIPLLYLPSYTHPLDDRRPRVTVIPGESKPWGLFVLTSWRAYLNENLQSRIHLDYREKQDLASGVDSKYHLPVGGDGILRSYYTNERDIHHKHLWTLLLTNKVYPPTTERERFRIQLRHVWEVDQETKATLEYHVEKDAMITKDFFPQESERGGVPQPYFQVIHSAPWYGLTFLVTKRVNKFESGVQQWPTISWDIRPLRIPWLPVPGEKREAPEVVSQTTSATSAANPETAQTTSRRVTSGAGWFYQSSSGYTHFNQLAPREGTQNSVLRLNTLQEVFYSARWFRWLNLRPFTSIQQTWYSRGTSDLTSQLKGAFATGVDLSTKLFRVFDITTDLLGLDIHLLRHVITPTVAYRYQAKPTLSADRFLHYDGTDTLAKSNTVNPGIEHKLQTKRFEGGSWQAVDVARFLTDVTYDLEGASGRGGRWNNVGLDLETKPYRWMYAESDAQIDPHIGKVLTINADFVVHPSANQGLGGPHLGQSFDPKTQEFREFPWAVGLGWRYVRDTNAQLSVETDFNIGKKWRVGMYHALDVKRFVTETTVLETKTVKKIYDLPEVEYRLRRDLHEWTVELDYSVRRGLGTSFLLLFRLKDFPDLPLEFQRGYNRPKAGKNFPKLG